MGEGGADNSKNSESALMLNRIADGFSGLLGESISTTQNNINVLIENEEKIKEFIQKVNNSENGEAIDMDCKEVQKIIKTLIEVILLQKQSNEQYVENLESEREKVKSVNEKLIAENSVLQKDQLTGLGNRHLFNKDLQNFVTAYVEQGKSFSLGIIDIDDFKKINDRYGHNGGDIILKYFAKFLDSQLPDEYSIYRFGGEEFIIVVQKDRPSLKSDLEQVLDTLNKTVITSSKNKNLQLKISFSAGTTAISQDDDLTDDLGFTDMYDRADAFLYDIKNSGKNAVK